MGLTPVGRQFIIRSIPNCMVFVTSHCAQRMVNEEPSKRILSTDEICQVHLEHNESCPAFVDHIYTVEIWQRRLERSIKHLEVSTTHNSKEHPRILPNEILITYTLDK